MRSVLAWCMFGVLLVHVGAHLAIVVGLAARRQWTRAAAALVVTPLAVFWGFEERMTLRASAWLGAVVLYVIGLALA